MNFYLYRVKSILATPIVFVSLKISLSQACSIGLHPIPSIVEIAGTSACGDRAIFTPTHPIIATLFQPQEDYLYY